ncbi:MAG: amidohydrolase [Candidatus Bathyarchaeia archaeon]
MEKADILISGCTILTMDEKEPIQDGAIAVKDGKITFVGKSSETRVNAETKLDARGKVALPGLVNAHTHVAMTLFRGLAEDRPLDVWLKETIWPLEAKLKPEDIYKGARLGCLEMIKSGTTCFADMYFHEEMAAKAVLESGLRAALAEGIVEAGNKVLGKITLKRSVEFAKKFDGSADGRIRAFLGPHAAYSCSVKLLKSVCEWASKLGVGLHIHLAESKVAFRNLEGKGEISEAEFLDEIGLFKNHTLAAHCINLSESDMRLLADHSVHVAHVPVANMKLGLGAARIKDLMNFGVNVGLGTDGPASNNTLDMFETMKVAALLQKHLYGDASVLPAHQVLKMATINAAKSLGLDGEIGSLEVGKKADIILVDLVKPHLRPIHDVYACLVYSARGSDVDTVIVDGKILMLNREVKTLDENCVIAEAEKVSMDLLSRK